MARSQPDAPTVMVVEDIDAVCIVPQTQLIILGYRVFEARNGLEALKMAKRKRPDLILMDVALPHGGRFQSGRH